MKKKKYHKSDTFTFSQLREVLVVDGQVQTVQVTPATFKGWDNALKLSIQSLHLAHPKVVGWRITRAALQPPNWNCICSKYENREC
jgi:hypothetical protein